MTDDNVRVSWDLDTAFNEQVDQAAVKEATAFPSLPSGGYKFIPDKKELIVAGEKSPWVGRKMVHLFVTLEAKFTVAREDGSTYQPKGKIGFDISHEERRDGEGRLDKPSKLFAQYAKALGKESATVGEVIESISLYPVDGFITEVAVFKGEGRPRTDGSIGDRYATIRNDGSRTDEMKSAAKGGAEFKNYVQTITAAK